MVAVVDEPLPARLQDHGPEVEKGGLVHANQLKDRLI